MKKVVLFVFIALLIYSCSRNNMVDSEKIVSLDYSISPIDLKGTDAKFIKDLSYDKKERTQFDIWLPESDQASGLVIYIHGGGFMGGDKSFVHQTQKAGLWDFPDDIRTFLSKNIAFASVRYSLLKEKGETEGVKKSLFDVKRALQYIRSMALTFKIDKNKIVLAGNSAGAGASLWLGLSDEMADPASGDAVMRESTRIKGIAVREAQASYDIGRWESDIFAPYQFSLQQAIRSNPSLADKLSSFYGMDNIRKYISPETVAYRKSVDMLNLMSSNDPEIWINNTLQDVVFPSNLNLLYHHAFHAKVLKEWAEKKGVKTVVYYGKNNEQYRDPSNETWVEFAIRKINE